MRLRWCSTSAHASGKGDVLTGPTRRDQRAVVEAYLHRVDPQVVEFSKKHHFAAADAFVRFGKGFKAKSEPAGHHSCSGMPPAARAG